MLNRSRSGAPLFALTLVSLFMATALQAQVAVGTAFTYQGRLIDDKAAASGLYDFQFSLYDAATGGRQVGSTLTREDVTVTTGIFTVALDFGRGIFSGNASWLEIAVRPGLGTGFYTTLGSRQELKPSPNAIYSASAGSAAAVPWSGLTGVPAGFADGSDDNSGGTVTSITAGTGLTGGTITGFGTIGVSFGTTGTTVATGDHDHFGQSWTGAAGTGLLVTNSQAYSQALAGSATITSGSSYGVVGTSYAPGGTGVYGFAPSASGANHGVFGRTDSIGGHGVYGDATATSGATYGVVGRSASSSGYGVWGFASATSGVTHGVVGESAATNGRGVAGVASATSGDNVGVVGQSASPTGRGVWGFNTSTTGTTYGVYGETRSTDGESAGVYGIATGAGYTGYGVKGQSDHGDGVGGIGDRGVVGIGTNLGVVGRIEMGSTLGLAGGYFEGTGAVYAGYFDGTSAVYAGYFQGDVDVIGELSKSSGSFKIDHPLDPENKYLYHSFVESPDMMNIYNGNVTTDAAGYATVELPEWFEALNRDFRYQLTVVDTTNGDAFVQAKIVRTIADNRFTVRTSAPNAVVSWQVTGIRKDAWAEAHRIAVEEDKRDNEKGTYLHPGVFGQPAEMSLAHKRFPKDAALSRAAESPKSDQP